MKTYQRADNRIQDVKTPYPDPFYTVQHIKGTSRDI